MASAPAAPKSDPLKAAQQIYQAMRGTPAQQAYHATRGVGVASIGPAGAVGPGAAKGKPAPLVKPKPGYLSLKQALGPDRGVVQHGDVQQAGLNTLGLGRVLVHSVEGLGSQLYHHPISQLGKTVTGVGNVVKGLGETALALPVYTAEYPVKSALHAVGLAKAPTDPLHFVSRIASTEAKSLSQKYGPSYRGEKGARARLSGIIGKEGPVPTVLDLATATPLIEGSIGKLAQLSRAARAGEEAGVVRAGAGLAPAKLRERPALKTNPVKEAAPQKQRSSITGATLTKGLDTARGVAQKAAEARSTTRLRVRLIQKATGRDVSHSLEGRAPGKFNTEPRPLTATRATVQPGEVVPISAKRAEQTQRLRVATVHTRQRALAGFQQSRLITKRGGPESLATIVHSVPEGDFPHVLFAANNGIRSSAGFKAFVDKRIAEIEKGRAAALAGKGKKGLKDNAAETFAQGTPGELAQLQEYKAHPEIFDRADIKAAADRYYELKLKEDAITGIDADRAAIGRAGPVGATIGTKTAKDLNIEAKAARKAEIKRAEQAKKAAVKHSQKGLNAAEYEHEQALKDLASARGAGGATAAAAKTVEGVAARSAKTTARLPERGAVEGVVQGARTDAAAAHADLLRAEKAHTKAREDLAAATARAHASHETLTGSAPKRGERLASGAQGVRTAQEAVGKAYDDLRHAQAQHRIAQTTLRRAESAKTGLRVGEGAAKGREGVLRPISTTTGRRAGASDERLQAALQRAEAAASEVRAARAVHQTVKQGHREHLAELRARPLKKITETGQQYEQRVIADLKQHGLVAPAHVKSGFERETATTGSAFKAPANPLAKRRTGTLRRLGREDLTHKIQEGDMIAKVRKAAALRAEAQSLAEHGTAYATEHDAINALREHQLNVTQEGLRDAGLALRKAPADIGGQVWVLPRAVDKELTDLNLQAGKPASVLMKLAHYPQAALLGGSLSWFQFQRVNDIIAATLGGSLHRTAELNKIINALKPEDREFLDVLSGGSVSSMHLQPDSLRQLGRWQEVLDSNPLYNKWLASTNPVSQMAAHFVEQNPLTALLRADQKITAGVRERQFAHNLMKVAREMDPHVAQISKAFGPFGFAAKTGNVELLTKLLNDPAAAAAREEAASRLYKVHGDWHNFTAREQKFKSFASFYGFLRYATRMAFMTLPLEHPYLGLLAAQLGQAGYRDAVNIIGPDQPFGIGKLYNDNGTVAMDLTRANPALSPLFQIQKPEQLPGLATPLAGILLNWITGQPLAQGNAAEGQAAQYSAGGNLNNHKIGGVLGATRLRIAGGELLSLLAPYTDWNAYDGRQQTSDSLAFSRKIAQPSNGPEALRIDTKNASAPGGVSAIVHKELGLFAGSSPKNYAEQAQNIAAAKQKAADAAALTQAKRDYFLSNPAAQVSGEAAALQKQLSQNPAADAAQQIYKLLRASATGK